MNHQRRGAAQGFQLSMDANGNVTPVPVQGAWATRRTSKASPQPSLSEPLPETEGMEIGTVSVEGWVADRVGEMGSTTPVRAILFSDHSAAYLDAEDDEWFIVDRATGHQINLAPFDSTELNYLALTCYFLTKSGDGERDVSDLIRASGRAMDEMRSRRISSEADSFVADFSQAAMELIDS